MQKFLFNNRKVRIVAFVLVWLIMLITCSYLFTSVVFGKYYSKGNSKGVATASGMYFSSDCLKTLDDRADGVTKVDANCTNFSLFSDYAISANGNETTEYVFNVHIKNYENQLLYNDSNLDITYNMYFRLIDNEENENIKYEVVYQQNNLDKTVVLNQGADRSTTKIENNVLHGGEATSDVVRIKVTKLNESVGISDFSHIAMWAIPVSPDYVTGAFKIGAILSINELSTSFSCVTKFDIEKNLSDLWSDTDKTKVNRLSGLLYDITVTGNPPEDKEWLKITWNTDYIDINRYDEYYKQALVDGKTGSDSATHKAYMIVKLEAYSYMQIAFYKVGGFDTNNLNNLNDFKGLVSCTYVTE